MSLWCPIPCYRHWTKFDIIYGMRDFLYMLGIIAAGFAINFGLRAVPFLLFGSSKKDLPKWVQNFGDYVSPVIIAGLIVYSFSGMAWKTPWPYLAGIVTVGIHIWKRNPLVSIVVGTVLYMCLLSCGCASQRMITLDAEHPSIRVATNAIYFGDEQVPIVKVAEILEDCDIPKTRTIHILLDDDVKDLTVAKYLMAYLAHAGWTRPVLVTRRHSEAFNTGKKKRPVVVPQKAAPARTIRYKRAGE